MIVAKYTHEGISNNKLTPRKPTRRTTVLEIKNVIIVINNRKQEGSTFAYT